jgi:hypothetical protein
MSLIFNYLKYMYDLVYDVLSTNSNTKKLVSYLSVAKNNICKHLELPYTEQISKHTYIVHYNVNRKMYKMIARPHRLPCKLVNIYSDNLDVSNDILPYLGCENNFNNQKYTPSDFGYEQLTFNYIDGVKMQFNIHDYLYYIN